MADTDIETTERNEFRSTWPMPLLEAQNIDRHHPLGQRWLLEDVSFCIDAGERVAVVGNSGAGKTLLLRCLALLDRVDAGRVCWQGRPSRRDDVPAFRRAVIYLHQQPVLWEETVEQALRTPFSLGVHRRRQFDAGRIVCWLARLGRDGSFLGKRTADLSGGEIQLAALLRAVQLDPAVLLLDEPAAALDAGTAGSVERLLADWIADSPADRALVWVTHNTEQAERVGDRIARMENGRIVERSS